MDVKAALEETGLAMLSLNTRRGDVKAGDNGLSAIPVREVEARAAIDEAISYAIVINTKNIHVMAGFARGDEAQKTFVANLVYACKPAMQHSITILIEPLNKYDAPEYFLTTTKQALSVMDLVSASNIKLMFDCYHVQLMEGDLTHRIEALMPRIGHTQFASVPDRGAPDHGEVAYTYIFEVVNKLGYAAPLGAEYKPQGNTDASLGWMSNI